MQRIWDTSYSEATYLQLNAALLADKRKRDDQRRQDELDIERMAYEQG